MGEFLFHIKTQWGWLHLNEEGVWIDTNRNQQKVRWYPHPADTDTKSLIAACGQQECTPAMLADRIEEVYADCPLFRCGDLPKLLREGEQRPSIYGHSSVNWTYESKVL